MPYTFSPDEAVKDSLRRCSVEQLDRALQELTDGVKVDPVVAVHAARKALKKERSLLRLGRSAIKPSARRRQNARVRDAARRLSGARDADVMISALAQVSDRYVGQIPATTIDAVRERLESQRDMTRHSLEASGVIGEVLDEVRLAYTKAEAIQLRRGGWSVVGAGLQRSYGRGRRAMERAQKSPTVENLHDWRKRAKDLWYHLRLLRPSAPRTLSGHIDEAHALSDVLGDLHDLDLLRVTLRELAPQMATDLGPLVALVDHRRAALCEQAAFVGARLYAETPKVFAARIRRYWKIARAEVRSGAAHAPADVAATARHASAL
jgi:CHAD domain-containing protein